MLWLKSYEYYWIFYDVVLHEIKNEHEHPYPYRKDTRDTDTWEKEEKGEGWVIESLKWQQMEEVLEEEKKSTEAGVSPEEDWCPYASDSLSALLSLATVTTWVLVTAAAVS